MKNEHLHWGGGGSLKGLIGIKFLNSWHLLISSCENRISSTEL